MKKTIFFFLIGFLIWALYDSVPHLVFYFDQMEGVAKIEKLSQNRLHFSYYNSKKQKTYSLKAKFPYLRDQKRLKAKKQWDIIYSENFPNLVLFKGIETTPGIIPPLVFIGIALLPIIYFNHIDFKT